MSDTRQGLEELANQKKFQNSLKQKQFIKPSKGGEDLDDFIEEDLEGEKILMKKNKITFAEEEEEQKPQVPSDQQQITQFMGQNKKKQKTGIVFNDDIDMDKVVQQVEVEKVTVKQVVTNQDELYKAQFNEPLQPQKQIQDLDLDDIFDQLEKQKEKEKQSQQIQKKAQPIHRKVELKVEINQATQELSTLSFDQIKQGFRDINDIVEQNGSILFYWLDVYEDQFKLPGALFVFGKVKNHKYNVYDTCSLYFDDYPKKIYLSYENGIHSEDSLLQECQLLMKKYLGLGVKDYKCQFVDRQYAFEIADIPTISQQYLEVTYTQKSQQQIPVRLDHAVFKYALQSTQTTIEQFLIYHKIKGPCWLQIKSCRTLDTKEFHLRTQHCLQVEPDKFVVYKQELQPPPLKMLSVAIKSCQINRDDQIIAITCAVQNNIDQNDAEVQEQINYLTLTRMPSDNPLPPGYVKGQNKQIKDFESEYSLLSEFLQYVEQVDPDALVGHDLIKKNLELLYARIAKLKVNEWNRMSRLQRREQFPKSSFVRSKCSTIGRLIIDTLIQASDMTKSNDYSLSYLSKQFLKQECIQIDSDVTNEYVNSAQSYQTLLSWNIKEAKYTIQLMQKLQIVSLTRQLTNIAGNVWNRSLINQRAERNEMLLMHEFYQRGFILPDRMSKINLSEEEREQQQRNQESQKTYGGGLVFEPKVDIYTQYILLLDFNSLYPSIIMEYKICFTTVIRDKVRFEVNKSKETQSAQKTQTKKSRKQKKEEQVESEETQQNENVEGEVDPEAGDGILPKIIETLVTMRKQAKNSMNKSTGLMKQIYNIKQLAVKLVANSIYGCLGFSSSRFYAVGIASLITKLGRKILMDSKQTVERNHDVIYGDTDSVMICTKQPQAQNLGELLQIGTMIVKEINKKYKKLVLGIDGVFETLLLLKKKKYAGIKIDNLEQLMAGETEVVKTKRETKGIDIVRREFCDISKRMQSHVLDILLTEKNRETIFDDVYTLMQEIKTVIDYLKGQSEKDQHSVLSQNKFIKEMPVASDFIIIKQLNKAPHEYADGINHPHVQIARRMVNEGRTPQSLVHHFIRYVICQDDNQKNISERAYTIEEMKKQEQLIDYDYYISTQIFDPIVRLCKNINGLLISQMATILGLKSYQQKEKTNFVNFQVEENEQENQLTIIQDLTFKCPSCGIDLKYASFFNKTLNVIDIICEKQCNYSTANYKSILNQTRLQIKLLCNKYYQGNVKCKITSTSFSLSLKCFGTCCQEDKRKKLKQVIEENEINDQVDLLKKFMKKMEEKLNGILTVPSNKRVHQYDVEKQFKQPYQLIKLNEVFHKLVI